MNQNTSELSAEVEEEIRSIVHRLGWGSQRPRLDKIDRQKADAYISQVKHVCQQSTQAATKRERERIEQVMHEVAHNYEWFPGTVGGNVITKLHGEMYPEALEPTPLTTMKEE